MGKTISKGAILFEEADVKHWDRDSVRAWMESQGFTKPKDLFYKKSVDGARLLRFNEETIKEMGVSDTELVKKLAAKIHELREKSKAKTDDWTTEQESKLIELGVKKLEKLRGLQNMSDEQKKDKSKNLVLKPYLLETYLNQNFVATQKTLTRLLEEPEPNSVNQSNIVENPTTSSTTNAAAALVGTSTAVNHVNNNNANNQSTSGGGGGGASKSSGFAVSVAESQHQDVIGDATTSPHQEQQQQQQQSSSIDDNNNHNNNGESNNGEVDELLAKQTKQDTKNLLRMKNEIESIHKYESQISAMKQVNMVHNHSNSHGLTSPSSPTTTTSIASPTTSSINPSPTPSATSIMTVTDEEYLRIKLVIVEIHQNTSQRTFRKVLSPIMDAFDISPTFGLFHSALIVGPWYLEWNDSGLIVPRKCYSGAAVLAADVSKQFKGGKQVKEALDKMADLICHWNANYQYSQNQRNCQTFIDEVCEALDIQLSFTGALNDYLIQLRKNGKCDLKYFLPDHLRTLLNTDEKYMTFTTHKQLDDFVKLVQEKDSIYFDITAPDDWTLLKSFDRAFWLRWFKNKGDENCSPHVVDETNRVFNTSCPFGHPHNTFSMVENFFTYKK